MNKTDVYFDSGKTISTPFKNLLFPVDSQIVKIQYQKTAHAKNLKIIEISHQLAEVYLKIEDFLFKLNPSLKNCYGTVIDCSAFGKIITDLNRTENQEKIFWFYFQISEMKLQISYKFKVNLLLFYNNNKDEIHRIFNIDENSMKKILSGKNVTNNFIQNKILISNVNNVNWFNFNLVNSKPLPLLFELFKGLNILKP